MKVRCLGWSQISGVLAALVVVAATYIMTTMPNYSFTSCQVDNSDVHHQYDPAGVHTYPSIRNNASGLTFDKSGKRLLIIINSPTRIVVTDIDGKIVQEIDLHGFHDTEAITHIKDDLFAIANERRMEIVLVKITPDTRVVDATAYPRITLGATGGGNKGIEGLAYDKSTQTLYAVKERAPKRLFRIKVTGWPSESPDGVGLAYEVTEMWQPPGIINLADISGLHYDGVHRYLIVLSDESRRVVAMDMGGRVVKTIELDSLVTTPIPQPEGVTVAANGTLYIVSEPNLLHRFVPRRNLQQMETCISHQTTVLGAADMP